LRLNEFVPVMNLNSIPPPLSRRQLLGRGVAASAALPVAGLFADESSPRLGGAAEACILIYLDGGASHIDLLDLKPAAPAELRGPFKPIATSIPGVQVGESLPLLARQLHHATLVRSMCHTETVHDPAVYQMLTGYKHPSSAGGLEVQADDKPQLAAAFSRADRRAAVMPRTIEIPETMRMGARVLPGQNAGLLGAAWDPFRLMVSMSGEVTPPPFDLPEHLDRRRYDAWTALLDQINGRMSPLGERARRDEVVDVFETYQRQARELVATPKARAAFELDREPAEVRDRYGRHRHGQSVLLARRLVEAGSRFVTVYWGQEPQDWADGKGERLANNPWDTHRNHFPLVRDTLAPRADQAVAALLADLHDRGQHWSSGWETLAARRR